MNTIKRVIYIFVMSAIVFMLSGCVNANYNLTLKNDGYLDVNFSVLLDSQEADEIDTAFLEEIKRRFTDIGYSIKEKSELGMTGFELSKMLSIMLICLTILCIIWNSMKKRDVIHTNWMGISILLHLQPCRIR